MTNPADCDAASSHVRRTTKPAPAARWTSRELDRALFALSDPTRRSLLGRLHRDNGQRTSELAKEIHMSRQAVRKHLEILERAELVATHRDAGETRHFLNLDSIRRVQMYLIDQFT
jgi:predicted transcriptional regulator